MRAAGNTAMFKLIETDEGPPGRSSSRCTPFTTSIDVSELTLERLAALYRAGHLPDSPGVHRMAEGLGWTDCVELDTAIALNVFIEVRLPEGRSVPGHEVTRELEVAEPRSSHVGSVAVPARRNVFDWWAK